MDNSQTTTARVNELVDRIRRALVIAHAGGEWVVSVESGKRRVATEVALESLAELEKVLSLNKTQEVGR